MGSAQAAPGPVDAPLPVPVPLGRVDLRDHLPYTVRLGRRVRIWHHSGMILNARSIGDDVHIRQNTTFGVVRRAARSIPTIGDRVDIGCGVVHPGRRDRRPRQRDRGERPGDRPTSRRARSPSASRPGSSGEPARRGAGHERRRAWSRSAGTRGSGSAAASTRWRAGAWTVVYVDSGSTDGSVGLARSMGVEVVELDMSRPFSAARARNAGFERLSEIDPGVRFVQFLDGDCEVADGWLDRAPGRAGGPARGRRRLRPAPREVPRALDLQPAGRRRVGHAASARSTPAAATR